MDIRTDKFGFQGFEACAALIKKLEKAVAVLSSLLEAFPANV